MKIVLFGYRNHPYTLDVMREMQKNNLSPIALIEPEHKYSIDDIEDTPEIDDEYIKSVDLKNLINLWSFKLFLNNPLSVLKIFKKIIDVKKQESVSKCISFKDIELIKVRSHSDKNCEKSLKQLLPDLIILCPASSIIRKNIIDIPKLGIINAHMGKLPEYRGMSAMEWTYLHTHKIFVTVHFVDEGVDTGDIISVNRIFDIPDDSNVRKMTNIARREMAKKLVEATNFILEEDCPKIPQKNSDGRQYYLMHEDLIKKVNDDLVKNRRQ